MVQNSISLLTEDMSEVLVSGELDRSERLLTISWASSQDTRAGPPGMRPPIPEYV